WGKLAIVLCFYSFQEICFRFLKEICIDSTPQQFSIRSWLHFFYSFFPLCLSRNHCAYVIEKSVSYTIQDGVAPYVKAEYNKCAWGKKCAALKYRMVYKPLFKVIHKTMTELEWRCCPGFTGIDYPLPDHHTSILQGSETEPIPVAQAPSGDRELNRGDCMTSSASPSLTIDTEEDSATVDRLNRMEEDVQRLSLGLETLRGKMTGLEDHLRASLREDANRMLSALLSAAPAPVAATSQHSAVGFGDLPGGAPDIEDMDMVGQFPSLGELAEKVEALHTELLAKSTELAELRGTVLDHNGTLQRLNSGAVNLTVSPQALETLVDSKLSEVRVAILEGFEKQVEHAEERCEGRATEVHLQCKKELMEGQGQLEQVLNRTLVGLRKEFGNFHGQLQGLEPAEACCTAVSGLTERLVLLEQSMDGLNQSQAHLQAELGGHKDHMEGMIEGRLGYVEEKLSMTEKHLGAVGSGTSVNPEVCLEEKMKALESRLFAAVEELGHAVDVDRFQKQLSSLELLCTSTCAPQPVLTGFVAPLLTTEEETKENHKDLNEQLNAQTKRLDHLNATLNSLLVQLSERQEEKGLESEVTLLKVSVHSVNRTICGLKDTLGKVVEEVGQVNFTWQDREERLAQQVKGVVQLVGRQASMLGAGERRLTRLKGELQDLRRRLAAELQGCRSTALGVQKEVTEVGGRVARVEGQCGGLAQLTEDLELIRGELDKHSEGYLSQINTTLVSHALQLAWVRFPGQAARVLSVWSLHVLPMSVSVSSHSPKTCSQANWTC
uniref:EMI domain-containing protein n=1 Tax=Pygocentrus nattereri TaxID=42514 RepID=A0AAR2KWV4_PYGNA